MAVVALDHVNIRTSDMAATIAFDRDLLGLRAAIAPGAQSMDQGCWIHDPQDRPIVHLGSVTATYPSDEAVPFSPGSGSGSVHHVALECDDYDGMKHALDGRIIKESDIPSIKLRQIFVHDPNGVMIELNFRG